MKFRTHLGSELMVERLGIVVVDEHERFAAFEAVVRLEDQFVATGGRILPDVELLADFDVEVLVGSGRCSLVSIGLLAGVMYVMDTTIVMGILTSTGAHLGVFTVDVCTLRNPDGDATWFLLDDSPLEGVAVSLVELLFQRPGFVGSNDLHRFAFGDHSIPVVNRRVPLGFGNLTDVVPGDDVVRRSRLLGLLDGDTPLTSSIVQVFSLEGVTARRSELVVQRLRIVVVYEHEPFLEVEFVEAFEQHLVASLWRHDAYVEVRERVGGKVVLHRDRHPNLVCVPRHVPRELDVAFDLIPQQREAGYLIRNQMKRIPRFGTVEQFVEAIPNALA